jgi:hypothetical protein
MDGYPEFELMARRAKTLKDEIGFLDQPQIADGLAAEVERGYHLVDAKRHRILGRHRPAATADLPLISIRHSGMTRI